MNAPLIFNVRRGSTEDGPGIRTTVFFKGCNLRCLWCHNPESVDTREEIGFYSQACVACGDCERACPESACRLDNPSRIDRAICARCGACADACPAKALSRVGHFYPPDELIDLLVRDVPFYRASGGGVTLSGGEPTLHMEYAGDILRRLKEQGIHTAIETNGFFPWDRFSDAILPNVDLIMMDVKLADLEKHREYTGESNGVIVENLRRIAREYPSLLLPRVPLVPGFTATTENLVAIGSLFRTLGLARYVLLPYNPTWFHKAAAVGKPVDTRLSARMPSLGESTAWQARFRADSVSTASCARTSRANQTVRKRGKGNEKAKPDDTDREKVHRVQARRA
jgi:pyruvate formate lyase activating enzyme